VDLLRYFSGILLKGLRKFTKIPVSIVGVREETQTGRLPGTRWRRAWSFPVRQDCLLTVSLRITELEIVLSYEKHFKREAAQL
jgi:hypothetical protein